tara:strand:- start:95 stop:199 length:105 start_codon:yes stop_codon:yes gene_type:complete
MPVPAHLIAEPANLAAWPDAHREIVQAQNEAAIR